ncbi:MAG: PilZ domain-containing protein [Hyphomicrobiaceae bacterium]
MSAGPVLVAAQPSPHAPQINPDRRLHARFDVSLLGRFMRSDKNEYPCRVHNMSIGDAAFSAAVQVEPGERIVAYLDQIGGIEGTVARVIEGGFAVKIAASQHKQEKLAAQITWLINRAELEGIDARRTGHERIASSDQPTILKLESGEEYEAKLLDVSISGASVTTDFKPSLGSEVMLGKLRALVVRHHGEGVGVQFLDIQNPDALRRYFG